MMRRLGERVGERRRAAYDARKRRGAGGGDDDDEDEDNGLWGVRTPESVALLSTGLLLRLAHQFNPDDEFLETAGGWGGAGPNGERRLRHARVPASRVGGGHETEEPDWI